MPSRRHSRRRMGGGGASEYGTALYGATPQAGEGNLIAMNKGVAMSGGAPADFNMAGNIFKEKPTKENFETLLTKYKDLSDARDEMINKDMDFYKKMAIDKGILSQDGALVGGRKSRMNFMMIPKMFMRMGRSRKHRRSTKRHHGKSRKHRK